MTPEEIRLRIRQIEENRQWYIDKGIDVDKLILAEKQLHDEIAKESMITY